MARLCVITIARVYFINRILSRCTFVLINTLAVAETVFNLAASGVFHKTAL